MTADDADERRLGRYELRDELGRGGMGVVHRAFDPAMNRTVAIKVLRVSRTCPPRLVERFLQEAQAVARLTHPRIVKVYEVGRAGDDCFIVQECAAGETLEARLARGDLSVEAAVETLRHVALALDHAHEEGIIHRDVKPSNILVDAEGLPKLLDFGLARDTNREGRLTLTGELFGTFHYMAPEQVGGKTAETGPATDVYGLGVVLYEAICGRCPFEGDVTVEILVGILQNEPTPPRALRPSLSPGLEGVVLRCLEKDPAARYGRASELAAALLAAQSEGLTVPVASEPTDAPASAPPPTVRSARHKAPSGRPWRAAVGAMAVCLLAIGLWAVSGEDSSRVEDAPAPTELRVRLTAPKANQLLATPSVQIAGTVEGNVDALWLGSEQVAVRDGRFSGEVTLPDGSHDLAVSARRGGPPLASVGVLVDTQPPRLTISLPAKGLITRDRAVLVRGTADDASLESVRLGERELKVREGAFSGEWVLSPAEGPQSVGVVARDGAGHTATANVEVILDVTPPALELSRPAEGVVLRPGQHMLEGRAKDARLASLTLADEELPVDPGGAFAAPFSARAEGALTVELRATDQAGNETSLARRLRIDGTPPVLTLEAPKAGATVDGDVLEVRGRARDDQELAKVEVTLEPPGSPVVAVVPDAEGLFRARLPLAQDGEYVVRVRCWDRAGNEVVSRRTLARVSAGPSITFEPMPLARAYGRKHRRLSVRGHLDKEACTVSVNGKRARVTAREFVGTASLREGANEITVVATDPLGREGRRRAQVFWLPVKRPGTWWAPPRKQMSHAEKEGLPLWWKNSAGLRFVLIPPGKFLAGSPQDEPRRQDNEEQAPVSLTSGYYVAATEVTNKQFRLFKAGHQSPPWTTNETTEWFPLNEDTQPVDSISRDDAQAFCAWLNEQEDKPGLYRLPTEAEWEYACRAGTQSAYSWGDDPGEAHLYCNGMDPASQKAMGSGYLAFPADDRHRVSAPVGSYRPNRWGLYDMAGNVSELVTGPRVVRGGSWHGSFHRCRSASRQEYERRPTAVGIRIVATRLPPQHE